MSDDVQTDTGKDRKRRDVLPDDMGLTTMILAVVTIALLLVGLSYLLYSTSPQSKYDLARPGEPTDRRVLDIEDQAVGTSAYVDAAAAKDKLDSLNEEVQALSSYNKYELSDLDDQNIGLQSGQQFAP